MAVTSKVETITPEIAREYLKHNTNNIRRMSRLDINNYARAIMRGQWQLNGETIVFGENGVLQDGQQRLAAVVVANKPIQCLVVRGIKDDVTVRDVGKRRTDSERAKSRGVDASASVIAAANIIVNRFSGQRDRMAVDDYVDSNISELNRAERAVGNGGHNAPSIVAAYLMLRTKTMTFYEVELFFRLAYDFGFTCADGYEVSPALVAQKMFDERNSTRGGGRAIQRERLEILVMALQDFHKGKKRELKYKVAEPFQFMELLNKVRKEDGLEG